MKRMLGCLFVLTLAGCPQRSGTLDYGDSEQLCVAISACMGSYGSTGSCVGSYVGRPLSQRYGSAFLCMIEAAGRGDCVAVRACAGLTTQLDASCTSSSTSSSMCSGGNVVGCSPGDSSTVPHLYQNTCSVLGASCLTSSTGRAGCYYGTCAWDGGRCTSSTHYQYCYDGVIDSDTECQPGSTCRETSSGGFTSASCVGGDLCTRSTCEGNSYRYCAYVDETSRRLDPPVDCGALGAHCILDTDGAHCEPDGIECDPSTFSDGCLGNALRYCGPDGRIHQYDCRARSFAGCREATTSFGSTYAYCAPSGLDLHL